MITKKIAKLVLTTAMAALGTSAMAQSGHWPTRPITMVVPFAAGGSTDITARMLAEKLGPILGQSVVVENKPGAAGNIGAAFVARAQPDGYTILLHTSTLTANVSLYKNMGLNVQKDLIPVSQVALIPNVLMVNNNFQAKTLAEFVEIVKQKKVPVNYGSSGSGASNHLAGVLFNNMVGGEMVHVPYKGGSLANNDLLAGQVQAVFSPMVEVLGYLDSGKLRPLAVTTKTRSSRIPNAPAIAEILPGYEIVLWNGIFAPAATPPAIVNKLSSAIQTVMKDPAVLKKLEEQGSTALGGTPADFKKVVDAEIPKWAELIKMSGAKVD
ncbi:Bug family tripartite tricarboxylate transporter substrate binding protein [Zwartia panacis]|uniref:Bug family tripartite tricarboxylate transporter substrate binding protein n=1 Tax=Zwartia panacis TaxID=2683345 RepID=UPI0025B5212A|nr:tripartite tricarboxylate transporter substrate binding protein [Zwartia panacis]MDN4015547.1 tripartite tricarboxylate transporter substrate binding protein [Zwartia panacis]